jgi:hypothetical protein
MLGNQIESFYAVTEGMIPLMIAVFAVYISLPFLLMVIKGRVASGIESLGNMLLGFIAMMSIIFLPVGINIFWGVYREALSHYIVTEETHNS